MHTQFEGNSREASIVYKYNDFTSSTTISNTLAFWALSSATQSISFNDLSTRLNRITLARKFEL